VSDRVLFFMALLAIGFPVVIAALPMIVRDYSYIWHWWFG
jgi:hypothetical protein